ncbi:MAG: cupin domain-containing protein [Candidatus Omnitrophota bacterium]
MINIIGRADELADLVEYQDGAVVSKEIIKKNTGTVTLFAFDKGQGLSEHTAPFDALVYMLDGKAEIIISGKSSDVRSGQAIMMPANKPHALKAMERFKMMLVMIKEA